MDKFLEQLVDVLEIEVAEISACGGVLADIVEWDSIARLGFVAMADAEYGKKIKLNDVKDAKTVTDLFNMIV